MFHDADFPIVAIPFMFVMMAGMGVMMWFMMKIMISGHDGSHSPSNSREAETARGMAFLRHQIASLQEEIAALQQELKAMRKPSGVGANEGNEPQSDSRT